jgi:hypothetical protein
MRLADHDVPERAGVAKSMLRPPQQDQPANQEEESLRSPAHPQPGRRLPPSAAVYRVVCRGADTSSQSISIRVGTEGVVRGMCAILLAWTQPRHWPDQSTLTSLLLRAYEIGCWAKAAGSTGSGGDGLGRGLSMIVDGCGWRRCQRATSGSCSGPKRGLRSEWESRPGLNALSARPSPRRYLFRVGVGAQPG